MKTNVKFKEKYELMIVNKTPLVNICNNDSLINKINELRLQFNQWSPEFLDKCLKIENAFKNNSLQSENNLLHFEEAFEIKRQCAYCKQYKVRKDLKKCSRCKEVRYCSYLCQKRHWNTEIDGHRQNCGRISYEIADDIPDDIPNDIANSVEIIEIEDID